MGKKDNLNFGISRANENISEEFSRLSNDYGKAALKGAMVINGGAAIAVLAFAGNILSTSFGHSVLEYLANGFCSFSFGVLSAAVGTAMGYLTLYANQQLYQKIIEEGLNYDDVGITFQKFITIKPVPVILCFRLSTFALLGVSFILFYFGVIDTAMAFSIDLNSECINGS